MHCIPRPLPGRTPLRRAEAALALQALHAMALHRILAFSAPNGTAIDQPLARHYASRTRVTPLAMAIDPLANSRACTGNLSCSCTHTLRWRSQTQPLPMERNPRGAFERRFGDAGTTDFEARAVRLTQRKSVLDSASKMLASVSVQFGPSDRGKVDAYTEAVRDVERRAEGRSM
ncbi:MAG: DUF1552 domain-containing protein [Acidobacteria bacterium]|nr:DUF1552 domain-containing protein [Acidobacteriota bacterium]